MEVYTRRWRKRNAAAINIIVLSRKSAHWASVGTGVAETTPFGDMGNVTVKLLPEPAMTGAPH